MNKKIIVLASLLIGIYSINSAEAHARHRNHHHAHHLVKNGPVEHIVSQNPSYDDDNNVSSFFMHDSNGNKMKVTTVSSSHTETHSVVMNGASGGNLIDKAKRFLGATGPQLGLPSRNWCGYFLAKLTGGHEGMARNYIHHGSPAPKGCVNCIAVMSHHVGIVMGWKGNNPELISGNHSHRVGIGVYSSSRIIGYRYI